MPERAPTPLASLPDYVACPACHAALEARGEQLVCAGCAGAYRAEEGIPMLFASTAGSDDVERVQAHYDHVAHEYDQVFSPHVVRHYLDKRLGIVRSLIRSGRVLDVGAGTGRSASISRGAATR
jgi:uncharacterized protein YbaR (Trm112 family)